MFWLNAETSKNKDPMSVTPEVSHALMSSLKGTPANFDLENKYFIGFATNLP